MTTLCKCNECGKALTVENFFILDEEIDYKDDIVYTHGLITCPCGYEINADVNFRVKPEHVALFPVIEVED